MDLIDWFFAPLSGRHGHSISPMISWHARCMVLAWGVLVPVAILLARYWKIWPRQRWPQELDSKVWWHGHRYGQTLAVALMTAGAWLAWQAAAMPVTATGTGVTSLAVQALSAPSLSALPLTALPIISLPLSSALELHASLGWSLLVLGWMQMLGGWLRGTKGGPGEANVSGDHFDMTPRRRVFEWTHKLLGWLALCLALFTIALGLLIVDAPRWMLLSLLVWWSLLLALAWRWQVQGKCIDTYQAIWGADPRLPGLKVAPIGFGIRRLDTANNAAPRQTILNTYPLEGDKP